MSFWIKLSLQATIWSNLTRCICITLVMLYIIFLYTLINMFFVFWTLIFRFAYSKVGNFGFSEFRIPLIYISNVNQIYVEYYLKPYSKIFSKSTSIIFLHMTYEIMNQTSTIFLKFNTLIFQMKESWHYDIFIFSSAMLVPFLLRWPVDNV